MEIDSINHSQQTQSQFPSSSSTITLPPLIGPNHEVRACRQLYGTQKRQTWTPWGKTLDTTGLGGAVLWMAVMAASGDEPVEARVEGMEIPNHTAALGDWKPWHDDEPAGRRLYNHDR